MKMHAQRCMKTKYELKMKINCRQADRPKTKSSAQAFHQGYSGTLFKYMFSLFLLMNKISAAGSLFKF